MRQERIPTKNPPLMIFWGVSCITALLIGATGAVSEIFYGLPSFHYSDNIWWDAELRHIFRLFGWMMIYPLTRFVASIIVILIDYENEDKG